MSALRIASLVPVASHAHRYLRVHDEDVCAGFSSELVELATPVRFPERAGQDACRTRIRRGGHTR